MNSKSPSQMPEGFTPRGRHARIIGMPMHGNGRNIDGIQPHVKLAEANDFPAIGTTLPAYGGFGTDADAKRKEKGPKKPKKHFWRHLWPRTKLKRSLLVILLIIIIGVGWFGSNILSDLYNAFHGNVFGIFNSTRLRGEDRGRVNILLAGNSADDPGHDGANLTDSIMIISIDTKNNRGFMLSVPRDLWVDVPGHGHAKINTAYVDGHADDFSEPGYFDGGMGLLQKVIEQNFNIPIDYYALINYDALRDAVNAVGGIDIDIKSPDPRGLYDPNIDWTNHQPLVKLSNGWHHLNGQQALDLARARGDSYYSYGFPQSDFNRTQHQQQMLTALKDKIFTAGTLTNPVALTKLFDALGNNVQTDFTLGEVHRLYDIGKNINGKNLKSVTLNDANGQNFLSNATYDGQSALIPAAGLDDYSQIDLFIKQLETPPKPATNTQQ